MGTFFRIVGLCLVLLCPHIAMASVPKTLTYQGYLTDSQGKAMVGTSSIVFSLYKEKTGGTVLWTETLTVALQDGHFTVVLGASKAMSVALFQQNPTLYLGVQVEQDPEMTPRTPLTSVPFARVSQSLAPGASIDVSGLKVGGKSVIDTNGKWVGSTTGLQGPKGDKGPKGDPGSIKTFTCPNGTFLVGITATGTPQCARSNGNINTYKSTITSAKLALPTTTTSSYLIGTHAFSDTAAAAVFYTSANNGSVTTYYTTNGGTSWKKGASFVPGNVGATRFSTPTFVQAGSGGALVLWRDTSAKRSGVVQIYNNGASYANRLNMGDASGGLGGACQGDGNCLVYAIRYASPNYTNQVWTTSNGSSWRRIFSASGQNSRVYYPVATGTQRFFQYRRYNTASRTYTYEFRQATTTSTSLKISTTNSFSIQRAQGNLLYLSGVDRYFTTNGGSTFSKGYPDLFTLFPSTYGSSCHALPAAKLVFCTSCATRINSSIQLPYTCVALPDGVSGFPRTAVSPSGKSVYWSDGTYVYRWQR
jgi:hypothetical protein